MKTSKIGSNQKPSAPKKLRILCLHGYNNTALIMMYQMQNFINTMGDICEFTFIDGPQNVTREAPIKYFIQRGIKPPYKKWMTLKYEPYRTLPDGTKKFQLQKSIVNFDDVIATNLYILEFMNKQDEPFDGICGFSQGMY